MMNWSRRIMRIAGPAALFAGVVMLAACGSTATAGNAAAAASTCTTTPRAGGAAATATVTGTISALATTSFTVTASTGKTTTVQYSSTTRYTHLQTIPASSLTSGTNVTVLTQAGQTNGATVAQTIIVNTNTAGAGTPGAGNGGFGGGFGAGGSRGGSFPNANCFRRGSGTPRTGGANNPGFRGLTGTVASYNAGTQQLTVTDPQGATFLVTINSSTTIGSSSQGSQADLKQGVTVTVRGTANGTSIDARQIQVFTTSQ